MKESKVRNLEKISRERIIYIINTFCDGNRMELARRANIGKSSISQYVNGTNAPGNITAAKIGSAFGIDPMWVMGFDVPMERASNLEEDMYKLAEEKQILDLLSQMTDEEKKALYNYMKFIISQRKET